MEHTCIIISGPTASGKTALAIELALHLQTSIISADSRQCFRELNIGVAKPSPQELEKVHHYFINSHSIHDEVNAAIFEKYALGSASAIFQKNKYAIMVGGTGLYIKAFCEGMDEIPAIDQSIRKNIISNYESSGLVWLQQQVQQQDPEYYAQGEIQNPQRLMRALEVKLSTGRSVISFQQQQKKQRPFRIIQLAIDLPRAVLYDRIDNRVDEMMKNGLLDEVKQLMLFKDLNALQTVGYRELFSHLQGEISLERAVELIKQNTRHYAKRQLTWFKKDESIRWIGPSAGIKTLEDLF